MRSIEFESEPTKVFVWTKSFGQFTWKDKVYNFGITQADYGEDSERLVHVWLEGNPESSGVIGKDSDLSDNKWDEVFVCDDFSLLKEEAGEGYKALGCDPATNGTAYELLNIAISFIE